MAVITVIATGNVRGILTACNCAVMARIASTDDLCVIDGIGRYPRIGRMAVFADRAGLDMRGILTRGIGTVMAAGAIARDVDVVEIRGQPGDGRVAVIAVDATGDIGWVFSCRGDAIVARTATTDDLCVVNGIGWYPDVGIVAVFANVCCLNMG